MKRTNKISNREKAIAKGAGYRMSERSLTRLDRKIAEAKKRLGYIQFHGEDKERTGNESLVRSNCVFAPNTEANASAEELAAREEKPESPFKDSNNYRSAVMVGYQFKDGLSGDNQYELPEVNRVALESRIIGWMYCQPWFENYRAWYTRAGYPDNDFWMEVSDFALQVAQDAITTVDPMFERPPARGED